MSRIISLNIMLSLIFCAVNGSRIMILSVFGTKSTMLNFQHLADHLASRGHEIVYVTGEKMVKHDPENISYIVLPFVQEDTFQNNLFDTDATYNLYYWYEYLMWEINQCAAYYEMKEVKQLLKENKIDAVIFDTYVQECFLPLVHSLKAPIIFFHGNALEPVMTYQLGIPTPYSYTLSIFYRPVSLNDFWYRVLNAFVFLQMRVIQEWFYYPEIEQIAKRLIPNTPRITDIMKNASLVMGALDNVWSVPRPEMSFVVDIGGLHCQPPSSLPQELENAIAEAGENGFILFAMGTYLKPENFPPGFLEHFINAFSKLDQVILWKYNTPLKNLPPNVKTFKWLPQQDLLGHPKIRLFISHGGLYSLYEAIYNAVPILGIGVFGDQVDNVRHATSKGIAFSIDKRLVSEESVYQGIITVLNNSSYKYNIQEMSAIMKDQPETPIDRAIYWTEYVIRHKDVSFLHGSAKELNFSEYFCLFEISFLISICLSLLFIAYLIGAMILRKILSHFKEDKR